MSRFCIGDRFSYTSLFGGVVSCVITGRDSSRVSYIESWISEDSNEMVTSSLPTIKYVKVNNDKEFICVWDYHDERCIVSVDDVTSRMVIYDDKEIELMKSLVMNCDRLPDLKLATIVGYRECDKLKKLASKIRYQGYCEKHKMNITDMRSEDFEDAFFEEIFEEV